MGQVIAPILHALAVEMSILDPASMTNIRASVLVGPFTSHEDRMTYEDMLHMSARSDKDSIGEPIVDMILTIACDISRMQARRLYPPGFMASSYARIVRMSLKLGDRTPLLQRAPPQWSLVPAHHHQ